MPLEKNALNLVDSELRPTLDVFKSFVVSHDTLPILRNAQTPVTLETPSFKNVFVPRADAEYDLRLVVITPDIEMPQQGLPALLYMHGGGFVFGSPETILPTMQRFACDVGCVIVLPAYRLAPEAVFPAALDDNYLALSWLHENANGLGIDTSRIAIGGDSAGGGHAAVLSIAARDKGEFSPLYQLLLYPMLDDRTGSTRPAVVNSGEFIWTPENNIFGWSSYLGHYAGSDNVPKGAVPAREEDLSGLPPTLIATGSLDLFAQENIHYGKRLSEQKVNVDIQVFEGAFHGFNVIVPDANISRRFHKFCVDGLTKAFNG